jgi:hypothetical protein
MTSIGGYEIMTKPRTRTLVMDLVMLDYYLIHMPQKLLEHLILTNLFKWWRFWPNTNGDLSNGQDNKICIHMYEWSHVCKCRKLGRGERCHCNASTTNSRQKVFSLKEWNITPRSRYFNHQWKGLWNNVDISLHLFIPRPRSHNTEVFRFTYCT